MLKLRSDSPPKSSCRSDDFMETKCSSFSTASTSISTLGTYFGGDLGGDLYFCYRCFLKASFFNRFSDFREPIETVSILALLICFSYVFSFFLIVFFGLVSDNLIALKLDLRVLFMLPDWELFFKMVPEFLNVKSLFYKFWRLSYNLEPPYLTTF